jgi:hypothetical protein
MAYPRSFADSDATTAGNALFNNRYLDIFVGMIVVHDENLLRYVDIPIQLDAVFGRQNAAVSKNAIIPNYDCGVPVGFVGSHIEPRMGAYHDRTTNTHSWRPLPAYFTGEMKRHIASKRSERIREPGPQAIHFSKPVRKDVQRVLKWSTIARSRHLQIFNSIVDLSVPRSL